MNTLQKQVWFQELNERENWSLYPLEDFNLISKLHCSIGKIGILHPPIVQKISRSQYRIINGRKRIKVARELNLTAIQCHILEEQLPVAHTLKIHLAEQQLSKPLSVVEQAYLIQLCKHHINENDILNDFLPALGYSPKNSIIERLLRFLQLEKELQSLLHNQLISEKTAITLLELDPEDRTFLGNLFVELNIGKGKQNRLLMLCHDLSRRHHRSIQNIFSEVQIKNILQHPEMSSPQKISRILEILQTLHSPELFKAEKDFQNRAKNVQLPKSCNLSHTPAFEKDEITLKIKFNNFESCVKTLEEIRHSLPK